jgi:hypothetical protein
VVTWSSCHSSKRSWGEQDIVFDDSKHPYNLPEFRLILFGGLMILLPAKSPIWVFCSKKDGLVPRKVCLVPKEFASRAFQAQDVIDPDTLVMDCSTITSLVLYAEFHSDNATIITFLNTSHLPELRRLTAQMNMAFIYNTEDEHRGPSVLVDDVIEIYDKPKPEGICAYDVELRKRMPKLEHVDAILKVDNRQVSQQRMFDCILSTKFTRACWRRKLLDAFVRLRKNMDHEGEEATYFQSRKIIQLYSESND